MRLLFNPAFAFFLILMLVKAIHSDLPRYLLPSETVCLLFLGVVLLSRIIRNPINIFFANAWIFWYVIGSINVVYSYLYYGRRYALAVDDAGYVYIFSTGFFVLGLFFSEILSERRGLLFGSSFDKEKGVPKILSWIYFSFPFAWIASIYISLGYFPILQGIEGVDLTEDIYELNYGPLYGFGLILVLSSLVAVAYAVDARRPVVKWIWGGLALIFMLLSVVDGKRYTIVLFALAVLFLLVRRLGMQTVARSLLTVIPITVAAYVLLLFLRQGWNLDQGEMIHELVFRNVGVEFRDFVFAENRIPKDGIEGYDFFSSLVGSVINGGLLQLFGFSKKDLVEMGSAYSWKHFYDSPYGIRTGIVSELYFAYGLIGVLLNSLLGLITGWLAIRLSKSDDAYSAICQSVILALLLVGVMGQATATAGQLTVLLYVWILYRVLHHLVKRRGLRVK